MEYSFIVINMINAIFLVLPIYSIYSQLYRDVNNNNDTICSRDNEFRFIKCQLLEMSIFLISISLYTIQAIAIGDQYKIVYFSLQIVISFISMAKICKHNNLKTQNFQIVCDSPFPSERGVLLHHEDNSMQTGYHSIQSDHIKQPSKQLDFFVDEDEDDEDEVEDDDDGYNQIVDNKRFKLNAPVLATLLLLSPVHTEALPIIISPSPISTGTQLLSIVAFTFILLSKLIRLGNCHYNKIFTSSKITIVDFCLILTVLVSKLLAGDLFVYQNAGHIGMTYILLGLDGLLVCQSVLSV